MPFSINTNIASLQAQNYLQQSSNFQTQTINEVTSGMRRGLPLPMGFVRTKRFSPKAFKTVTTAWQPCKPSTEA